MDSDLIRNSSIPIPRPSQDINSTITPDVQDRNSTILGSLVDIMILQGWKFLALFSTRKRCSNLGLYFAMSMLTRSRNKLSISEGRSSSFKSLGNISNSSTRVHATISGIVEIDCDQSSCNLSSLRTCMLQR